MVLDVSFGWPFASQHEVLEALGHGHLLDLAYDRKTWLYPPIPVQTQHPQLMHWYQQLLHEFPLILDEN